MAVKPRPQLPGAHPVDARGTGVLLDASERLGKVLAGQNLLPQTRRGGVSGGAVRRRVVAALWPGVLRLHRQTLPARPHEGVGCDRCNDHEHERPDARLRVRPFPAISIPAGNTASADFSTASDALTSTAVPHHPANQKDGASGTPMETSTNKTSNLHRTPIAFTDRPLDGHRASPRGSRLARTDPPYTRSETGSRTTPGRDHVFLGSRLRTPASSPPSLTTEQLPSACGWCHQPPQGTRTPELLIMSCVLPACALTHWAPALGSGVEPPLRPGVQDSRLR